MVRITAMALIACATVCLFAASGLCQAPPVELHGYMLNRMYTNPSMSGRFVQERVSLSATGKLGEDATGYVELYFHHWAPTPTYLESAYVDLPLGPGRIRIGKGRQINFGLTPGYPNRKTTQYGILSETFTMDRIQGFQWTFKSGSVDGGVSLFNDQNLGTRGVGYCPGAVAGVDFQNHICDRDVGTANSGRMAASAKIGVTRPGFQFHVSGCVGGLNPSQLAPVDPFVPAGTANTNTDHNKFGLDFAWSPSKKVDDRVETSPFFIQGEWYTGKFSLLGISGYQIMVGWQPKDKPRYVLKWAALENDKGQQDGLAPNPLTWDVQQLTLGYVYPIRKGVWMEINYEKNMTSNPAGTTAPKTDMLIWEFFTGF